MDVLFGFAPYSLPEVIDALETIKKAGQESVKSPMASIRIQAKARPIRDAAFRRHSSLNYRPPAPESMMTTWILHNTQEDPFPIPGGQGTIPLT